MEASVEIFYQDTERPSSEKPLMEHNMLFSFSDIETSFQKNVTNWFEREKTLSPVFNLFFSPLYNTKMYLDTEFLTLTQALEAYYGRGKEDISDLPEAEHEKRVESILTQAPEVHRDWLRKKLKYSNKISFRQKIKQLYDDHREAIGDLIDRNNFSDAVFQTRNYYTHYTPSLEAKASKGRDLFILTEKLRILLEAVLLSEIGLTPQAIHSALRKKKAMHYLRKQ